MGRFHLREGTAPAEPIVRAQVKERLGRSLALPMRTSRCRNGFTLIEVLATMVLLAIVLPAIMRAAAVSLAAASSARHVTEATALGEAKLNELVALNQWSQNGSGDFSPENPTYRWSIENAARDYGVYDVRITVTWSESGKERKLMLSTLVYASTSSTEGLP